jgi:hypothetical protein
MPTTTLLQVIFYLIFRPLKFLGPTNRKDEEFVFHMDANASFKENEVRKRRNPQESKKKPVKCSLLKFLEAKAQKKSQ